MATQEIEVLIKFMQEGDRDGWLYSSSIEDVPEDFGHYSLHDGLKGRGCGVTANMRQSIKSSYWFTQLQHPIFSWLPDTDGSAALWLEQKTCCSRCTDSAIFDLDEIDRHGVEVHGDEEECVCN